MMIFGGGVGRPVVGIVILMVYIVFGSSNSSCSLARGQLTGCARMTLAAHYHVLHSLGTDSKGHRSH